jgi:hypothetical protein
MNLKKRRAASRDNVREHVRAILDAEEKAKEDDDKQKLPSIAELKAEEAKQRTRGLE